MLEHETETVQPSLKCDPARRSGNPFPSRLSCMDLMEFHLNVICCFSAPFDCGLKSNNINRCLIGQSAHSQNSGQQINTWTLHAARLPGFSLPCKNSCLTLFTHLVMQQPQTCGYFNRLVHNCELKGKEYMFFTEKNKKMWCLFCIQLPRVQTLFQLQFSTGFERLQTEICSSSLAK